MTWEEIWKTITNYFESNVWNIVIFFSGLVIGFIVIFLLMVLVRKLMRKKKVDEVAIRFTVAALRFFLWLILILVLLSILGVPITGLTTAFSAVVLAIGVALKEFLSNIASGLILVGSRKYHTGDFVVIGTNEGFIEDVNFLFTTLRTYDHTQINLPNSMMVNSAVTNLGAYDTRRVAITISVSYESDVNVVRKTMVRVMESCGLVHKDPAPLCHLKTLGESSIDFFVTCYCDTSDYWDTYYYVMDHGFDELKRAGIKFPFKQVVVSQKETVAAMPQAYEALPKRVEKVRKKKVKKVTIDDLEEMNFQALSEAAKAKRKAKKARKEKPKKDTTEEEKPEKPSSPETKPTDK